MAIVKDRTYPMENGVFVAPPQPSKAHCHPALDFGTSEEHRGIFDNTLQVAREKFQHRMNVAGLADEDVQKTDDVLVAELLQVLDFSK